MIVIPEVIIKRMLDSGILFFKNDWVDAIDKSKSYLFMLFSTLSLGDFNFYDQLVDLLTRDETDPRHLEVNYFYNSERQQFPTIHITLPNENPSADNGLGQDEGYRSPIIASLDYDEIPVYNRSFASTYNIVITSENSLEVVGLYHLVRSLLVSMFIDMENQYLSNPKISGGDLTAMSHLIPENIFVRNIALSFNYSVPALKLSTIQSFRDVVFHGVIDGEDESSSS